MASFEYIWLSVGNGSEPYQNIGYFIRRGSQVRWSLLQGLPESLSAQPLQMIGWAEGEGSAPELWEYIQERALGGMSSATSPRVIEAKDWADAKEKVARLRSRVQHGG